ncbi:phage tail sheath subtilisin-like domain-containing protein [Cumulibacter manganitolerans]|uniref:phage tail sheath subtilisin-like domain-containing protein n=1 Tax=Cumulibacter manganitolerans TaxID=1884992 RepID=UPI0012977BAB|nr:phage tail sheath subtilisin-like domain-containing protein [Cumulibacter manganitolerans]
MAVQVSYPGVYIDEFAPGAPIEGVSTSTAVFIGVAEKGPRNVATLVQSWDKFQATFGGFLAGVPGAWLAQGVYGFFLNGGTTAYVVRVSQAAESHVPLPGRGAGVALEAYALAEGPAGDTISVSVSDSSRSGDALAAITSRAITAVSGDKLTLTVADSSPFIKGSVVTLVQGADRIVRRVDAVTATTIVLKTAVPAAPDLVGGQSQPAITAAVLPDADIQAMPDRTTLTMADDEHGIVPGDNVRVAVGAARARSVVAGVSGKTITLATALPGADDYTDGTVRLADLVAGNRRLRISAPVALPINQVLPAGTLLRITRGGTTELVRVAAAGGDIVSLDAPGLVNGYPLDDVEDPPVLASAEFDLAVQDGSAGSTSTYPRLSMDPRHPGYWATVVSDPAVRLAVPDPAGPPRSDPRPAVGSYPLAGGVADDPAASLQALINDPGAHLDPLAARQDISLVVAPGITDANLQQAVVAHCERLYDRFAILDPVPGADIDGIVSQFGQVRSVKGFAALYYPGIVVRHPFTGVSEVWPPSGHLAGIYARTDQTRGVHKAPANTNVRGALGVETLLSNAEQGPINLMGINALRVFPGRAQPVVWGARTTAGDLDRNWQYVNIRRLFIFLEQSIERSLRGAVFEPNDLALWQRLKRTITNFLTQVWKDGALFGAKAEQAFYVRIDEALNPPSTRALGRLYIEVGVVPTYPAEFIVLRIGIWDGGAEVTES